MGQDEGSLANWKGLVWFEPPAMPQGTPKLSYQHTQMWNRRGKWGVGEAVRLKTVSSQTLKNGIRQLLQCKYVILAFLFLLEIGIF